MRISSMRAGGTRWALACALALVSCSLGCVLAVDEGAGDQRAALASPPPDHLDEGLTNASSDLTRIFEQGALRDACFRYRVLGDHSRRTTLLCGKAMFFDEGLGVPGPPAALITALGKCFPAEAGGSLTKLGLIADPRTNSGLPIGFAKTKDLVFGVPTVTFSCASCHFARLADDRYSVGAPALDWQYGRTILAISALPALAMGSIPRSALEPATEQALKPFLDRLDQSLATKACYLTALAGLAPAALAGIKVGLDAHAYEVYASLGAGQSDIFMAPTKVDDQRFIVYKPNVLWGLTKPGDYQHYGMTRERVGWTGLLPDLASFLAMFITTGGGDTSWTRERMLPLEEYVYSLLPVKSAQPANATLVGQGKALFAARCASCHDTRYLGGSKVYATSQIGTDGALEDLLAPDSQGKPCCGVQIPGMTRIPERGVKVPRLVGMWSFDRFLHNGSVRSLDALFCKSGARGTGASPFYDGGHRVTCDGLSAAQKNALIAYLKSQ